MGDLMAAEKVVRKNITKHLPVLPVSTPDGERGPWKVTSFELTEDDVRLPNLRALRDGNAYLVCVPGKYKKLTCKGRGTIMSNTPMEVRTNMPLIERAKGHVLINGLGLGMVLEAVLAKPEVTKVTVVEIDPDVIALVGPTFASDPRVEIVHASAFDYKPPRGVTYGAVWHDIWDTISADNVPEMRKLGRKYRNRAEWQGNWCEVEAIREKRRWG